MCVLFLAELLSLLGSGLVGVADEDLDDIVSARLNEEGEELGGRESRVSLYDFNSPLVQVGGDCYYSDQWEGRQWWSVMTMVITCGAGRDAIIGQSG